MLNAGFSFHWCDWNIIIITRWYSLFYHKIIESVVGATRVCTRSKRFHIVVKIRLTSRKSKKYVLLLAISPWRWNPPVTIVFGALSFSILANLARKKVNWRIWSQKPLDDSSWLWTLKARRVCGRTEIVLPETRF